MSGWVKLHRSIIEWDWFDDSNTFKLFMYLIITANYEDRNWRGKKLLKGTVVTGRDKLSVDTNMSIQQVRSSLKKLQLTNEITLETNNQGTIIQIVNYEKYQEVADNQPSKQPSSNQRVTNEQPTSNQRITTIKESKEGKEIKEPKKRKRGFSKPSLSEVENYLFEKFNNLEHSLLKREASRFIDFYESNGWKVGKNPMKLWTSAMSGWMARNHKKELSREEKLKLIG